LAVRPACSAMSMNLTFGGAGDTVFGGETAFDADDGC